MNFIIFILYFYLILFSILGYGFWTFRFINSNKSLANEDIYCGFFGITFITIISLIVIFFLKNKLFFNFFFHLIGCAYFIYFVFKNNKKKFLKEIIILSIVLISLLFISKTNEDFGYYHLPLVKYLTEEKILLGISNIGHGYKFLSSLFNFNSLISLPKINFYSFHFVYIYYLIFFNFFCIRKFFDNNEIKNVKLLYLFAFVFFNLSFNRIAEYGTDKVGQLVISIIVIDFFSKLLLKKKDIFLNYLNIFIPILCLVITLKLYFLPWMLIFIVVFLYFGDVKWLINYFFSKSFLFSFVIFFLFFLTVFLHSGCLFPLIEISCFDMATWRIPKEEVRHMSEWLEFWSKSGARPNFVLDVSRSDYNLSLLWIPEWFKDYFLGKMTDQLGLLITTLLFIYIFFIDKKFTQKKTFESKELSIFFYIILAILLLWFFKHPQLRYGGYSAIFIFISITFFFLINKLSLKSKNFKKKISFFIIFTFLILNLKNIIRINSEFKRNDIFKYTNFPYYTMVKSDTLIEKKYKNLKIYKPKNGHCWDSQSICSKEVSGKSIDIFEWKNFYIIKRRI